MSEIYDAKLRSDRFLLKFECSLFLSTNEATPPFSGNFNAISPNL